MATIINSLHIQNFFNFYGDYDQNFYEFNPGLNLVIADNGNGKSKLFSAFSWLLKDQVIDSDRQRDKMVQVKTIMVKMISDKAKSETKVNNDVKCGVKINYSDDRYEYEVEKSLWGRRLNDGSPTDKDNWICNIEEVKVSKKDKILLDFKPVNDAADKLRIIHKLIRPEFLQYALFQGEEVDDILNFGDRNSLKSAIETITNINKVDRVIELASYLADKGEAELIEARKANTKSLTELNTKVSERDSLKLRLERKATELVKYQEDLVKAKTERDNLYNLLATARPREQLRSETAAIRKDLEKANTDHGEFLNNLNGNFFDNQKAWLFYNTQHYEAAFNKMRDQYIEARQERKVKNELSKGNLFLTKLPAGSPDSFSLRKMLKDETCFVCGRPAKENSLEWQHIKQVLEQHAPKPDQPAKHSFTQMLDVLMQSASSYFNQVAAVGNGFTDARATDRQYKTLKQTLLEAIDDKQNELIGLGDTKEEIDQATINSYGGAEKRVNKYEGEIKDAQEETTSLISQLDKKNIEIDKLTTGEIKEELIRRRDLIMDVRAIAQNAKKRIYNKVLKSLEDKSNFFFKELTKLNPVDGGIIRMTTNPDGTFAIEICDAEDNKMYGLSEGFQRMKKLAVITSIIANSDRGMMDYPLIADAPLSSFGKGFIQGFFDKVPEVFHQSIIMVKDLYDQNAHNLLNDIGNEVLNKIKVSSGSLHINQINEGPQISRETTIRRY